MESTFVQTPRLRFHCLTQGHPDAPPMLLLHGEFASSRWWHPFLEVMPEEIRAIAPDMRGAGQTDKPSDGYTIEDQCQDLEALVDQLELTDFDLVAHSAAGATAIEYALSYHYKLSSLTLVNTVPVEGVHTPIDTMMLLEQMREDPQLVSQCLALLMTSMFDAPSRDYANSIFFRKLVDDVMGMAPPLFTAFAESLNQWNRFAEVSDLRLPVLLIWGDQDQIVSQDAATRTLIAIPGAANLEILRGIGHSPMIEAPLRLAERIVDFITGDHAGFSQIRDSIDASENPET